MALITKEKVIEIIENRPEGTLPQEVISTLINRGHRLEGLNAGMNQLTQEQLQPTPQEKPQPQTGQKIQLSEIPQDVGRAVLYAVPDVLQTGYEIGKGLLYDLPKGLSSLAGTLSVKEGRQEIKNTIKNIYNNRQQIFDAVENKATELIEDENVRNQLLYNIKEAIVRRPINAALWASLFTQSGTKALSKIGTFLKSPNITKVSQAANLLAKEYEPLGLVTKAVGKGIQKIGPSGFKKTLDTKVIGTAAKRGIDLPMAAKTKSPFLQTSEVMASRGLFGKKIAEKANKSIQQITSYAENIADKVDGIANSKVAGKLITDTLNKAKADFLKAKSLIYNSIDFKNQASPILVDTSNTLKMIDNSIDAIKASNKIGVKSNLGKFLNNLKTKLSPTVRTTRKKIPKAEIFAESQIVEPAKEIISTTEIPKKINAYQVKEAIKNLNEGINFKGELISTKTNAKLKRIAASLNDDLGKALEGTEVGDALKAADNFYKKSIRKLNQKFITRLKSLEDNPEAVYKTILSSSAGSEQINTLKSMMGDSFVNIQKTALADIIKNSKNVNGDVLASKLASQIKKIGTDKLTELFTSEQIQALDDLKILANSMARFNKIAQGSQTAFLQAHQLLSNKAANFLAAFQFPLPVAINLIAQYIPAKLFTTVRGQEILIEGFKPFLKAGESLKKLGLMLNKKPELLALGKISNKLTKENQ